jgi:hypothetical protein
MSFRNCRSAFDHAGGPAQAHVARLPALDVARGAADDLDHRLARVRRLQRLLQRSLHAEPSDGECLRHSFPKRGGGAWVGALELAAERAQLVERTLMVVARPRFAQPLFHQRPVAFGQVVEHVSLCRTQRCTGTGPITSSIALGSVLAPSITQSTPGRDRDRG